MKRFACVCVAVLLMSSVALAEDDVRRIVTASTPMTKSLGGGKSGDLLLNAKASVLEEKGSWSKVSVVGWVRTSALSAPSVSKSAPAPVDVPKLSEDVLEVSDFVTTRRTDVSPARQYVVLSVKNISNVTITKWQAKLVGQDKSGKVVFSEVVTQEDLDLKPGDTQDATFYWEPSEELYSILGSANPGSLTLSLAKVKAN